jgi:hypothetical protein
MESIPVVVDSSGETKVTVSSSSAFANALQKEEHQRKRDAAAAALAVPDVNQSRNSVPRQAASPAVEGPRRSPPLFLRTPEPDETNEPAHPAPNGAHRPRAHPWIATSPTPPLPPFRDCQSNTPPPETPINSSNGSATTDTRVHGRAQSPLPLPQAQFPSLQVPAPQPSVTPALPNNLLEQIQQMQQMQQAHMQQMEQLQAIAARYLTHQTDNPSVPGKRTHDGDGDGDETGGKRTRGS